MCDTAAPKKVKTHHGLLFVNNRWDPATPLSNAVEASKYNYPGSGVIMQDNPGVS